MTRRRAWAGGFALLLVLVAAMAWSLRRPAADVPAAAAEPPGPATFVGNANCAGCHAAEAEAWRGSHHARAMQHAGPDTVLGDFDDARLEEDGHETVFLRRDGRYFVRTEGADGLSALFEIRHVIGFEPLQQYLVALPDGRLQALPQAWDARPAAEGGQRWYSLYPDGPVPAGDRLHWTGPYQNWNWMCADCHTTNLDRNYDPAADTFATTWTEFNVGCEACHGPGSRHVARAAKAPAGDPAMGLVQAFDERDGVTWSPDPATGLPRRSTAPGPRSELVACAQCHARRAPLAPGMDHDGRLLQTHEIALLDQGRYFPDGQQREEVYEVGSFMQSRMHTAGVTCADCHEPHSGGLRAPGDAVCGQCHAPSRFATPTHTLHAPGSSGSACVDCHMPARAYMEIDLRRDHSLRIPRPLASAAVGAPDACTGCHRDRDAAWADAQIRATHGPDESSWPGVARAFHAADSGDPTAGGALAAVAGDPALPAITRATALSQLRNVLGRDTVHVVQAALADSDPMLRGAAVDAMSGAPPAVRQRVVLPLAADDSRIVRIKAAEALADVDTQTLPAGDRQHLLTAFGDYEASRRANADRAEARVELATFLALRGQPAAAENELRAAITLQPAFVPAHLSLVDLLAASGRDAEVEAVIVAAQTHALDAAALVHALGLLRVREGRLDDALPLLRTAAERAPAEPRYAYVLAVALHDTGHPDEAIAALEAGLRHTPGDPSLRAALADYRQRANR